MSVKIKISYTDPAELEAVKNRLNGLIKPYFRQDKGKKREFKRYYINGIIER